MAIGEETNVPRKGREMAVGIQRARKERYSVSMAMPMIIVCSSEYFNVYIYSGWSGWI